MGRKGKKGAQQNGLIDAAAASAAAAAQDARQARLGRQAGSDSRGGGDGGPRWAVGDIIQAKYTDGEWYDAKVISSKGKGRWEVLYLGYNESEVVRKHRLRHQAQNGGPSGGNTDSRAARDHAVARTVGVEDRQEEEEVDGGVDEGEEGEDDEGALGIEVSCRRRMRPHKIGCLSAFPETGSLTALPEADRMVANYLVPDEEVELKGEEGVWKVEATVRNRAYCAQTMDGQQQEGHCKKKKVALFRDVILTTEQMSEEVERPKKTDQIRRALRILAGEESEEGEEEEDISTDEDDVDSESQPVAPFKFTFSSGGGSGNTKAVPAAAASGAGFGLQTTGFGDTKFAFSFASTAQSTARAGAITGSLVSSGSSASASTSQASSSAGSGSAVAYIPVSHQAPHGFTGFSFTAGKFGGSAEPTMASVDSAAADSAKTDYSRTSEYEKQLAILVTFYAKHDPSKDEFACRAILDKRKKTAPALPPADFAKLCTKLSEKYSEDPRERFKLVQAPAEPQPEELEKALSAASKPGRSFQAQVDVLTRFYAKYEPSKGRNQCEGILEKRSGQAATPLHAKEWVKLCTKLRKKYGEDPLAM